jgi:hypothetical protein
MATIFSASEEASLLETAITRYVQDVYPGNVLLSHVQREPMGGSPHPLAIKVAGTSLGGVFANAIATAREVQRYEAKINERMLYAIGLTKGPGARSSKGAGKKAIVDIAADCESDTKQRGSSLLEKKLLSCTGFGEIAKVAAFTGTLNSAGTITLTNPADCLYFKGSPTAGDVIAAKDVANTASLRAGIFTISGVDSQTGILTGTGSGGWDPTAGATLVGAVIGFNGDLVNSAVQSDIIGLPGWLNRTVTDVDGLLAAQRTANPQETSGWVTTGSLSVRDSINLMANQTFNVGGAQPSIVLVGTNDYQELQDDLGDRVEIVPSTGTVPINFDGIKFLTAKGKVVTVFPTAALNKDRYLLDTRSLHLVSPAAEIWQPLCNYGDRGFRSLENQDALRLDLVAQCAFGISHPGAQARYIRV